MVLEDRPGSGRIFMAGQDITEFSEDRLAPIRNGLTGFVFQDFHLVPSLTALENVMLGLLSSIFAVILAQIGSWAVCEYLLEISYQFHWPATFRQKSLTFL